MIFENNETFKNSIASISSDIAKIKEESKLYSETFSNDIRMGLISFGKRKTKKDIEEGYYLFVASLSKTFSSIEGSITVIFNKISKNDPNKELEETAFCDGLLTQYNNLRIGFSDFIEKCEFHISDKTSDISENVIYRYLTEFQTKIQLFSNYISSI